MNKAGWSVLIFNPALPLLSLVLLLTGCASNKPDYAIYYPPGLETTIGTNKAPLLKYSVTYSNQLVSVQEMDLETVVDNLPPYLRPWRTLSAEDRTRLEALAQTAAKELPKNWMISDYHFSRMECFQASDGLSYLVDHHEMALYYRQDTKAWTNAIRNIYIVKTFGGSPPDLHIRYLGANKFLFPQTLPEKTEPVHWSKAEVDPMTGWTKQTSYECQTLLFDCVEKRILARSESKTYDPEPSITLSDEWKTQYGIRFEPEWMVHDPGQVGFMRPRSRRH